MTIQVEVKHNTPGYDKKLSVRTVTQMTTAKSYSAPQIIEPGKTATFYVYGNVSLEVSELD